MTSSVTVSILHIGSYCHRPLPWSTLHREVGPSNLNPDVAALLGHLDMGSHISTSQLLRLQAGRATLAWSLLASEDPKSGPAYTLNTELSLQHQHCLFSKSLWQKLVYHHSFVSCA